MNTPRALKAWCLSSGGRGNSKCSKCRECQNVVMAKEKWKNRAAWQGIGTGGYGGEGCDFKWDPHRLYPSVTSRHLEGKWKQAVGKSLR